MDEIKQGILQDYNRQPYRHGGDIYRNHVDLDFSVNVNPFGMPEEVKAALHDAVEEAGKYPDITAEKLKAGVSAMLSVPEEYLLFGNGASELFMAAVHGLKPGKTVIPVPSFYGYEYAAVASEREIVCYPLKEENGFLPEEDLFEVLSEDINLLFLANPNNPTGTRIKKEALIELLSFCKKRGIWVVLDECFVEFCENEVALSDARAFAGTTAFSASMVSEIERFPNLILVRAFTKIFAIPGVRLGYLICSNLLLMEKIKRQLPEWNLSVFAQAAGCACMGQHEWIKKTAEGVRRERQFLAEYLRQRGIKVFPSEANFLLIYSERPLYEELLAHGILIRDCENFRGLKKGYYRIAVRSREENEALLEALA